MQVYKAAKYIRLSYTDDKSNESNSVGKSVCFRGMYDRIGRCLSHNNSSFLFILDHQNHMNKAGHTKRAARPHGI